MVLGVLICIALFCLALSAEFEVHFNTTNPLGLQLDANLKVYGFAKLPGSTAKLPAETSGWIRTGDTLIAVNDEDVIGKPLSVVQGMVANAALPKRLRFDAMNGGDRVQEMKEVYDGPSGIHGHRGILELGRGGYILGSVPYLQAMFGGPSNSKPAPLVIADPIQGCGAYRNQESIFDAFVLVARGLCTFSDKATIAEQAHARGLIVMNDDANAFVRMPIDPHEAKKLDINLPAIMIDTEDSQLVMALVNKYKSSRFGRSQLVGRMCREGHTCKPWKNSTEAEVQKLIEAEEVEANVTIPTVGDPMSPGGYVLVHLPGQAIGGSLLRMDSNPNQSAAAHSDMDHSHGFGVYNEEEHGRRSDGFLNSRLESDADENDHPAALRQTSKGQRLMQELDSERLSLQHSQTQGIYDEDEMEVLERELEEGARILASGEIQNVIDLARLPHPLRTSAGELLRNRAHAYFEYMKAKFGGALPQGRLPVKFASPATACAPLEGDYSDHAVVVVRGECPFAKKAEFVAKANGVVVLVANPQGGLFSMTNDIPDNLGEEETTGATEEDTEDIEDREDEMAPGILPSILISEKDAKALREIVGQHSTGAMFHTHEDDPHYGFAKLAHYPFTAVTISFLGDEIVPGYWQEIMRLSDHANWPNDAKDRRKLYFRLTRIHHPDKPTGSADRFDLVAYYYRRANYKYDPASEPDFVPQPHAPIYHY